MPHVEAATREGRRNMSEVVCSTQLCGYRRILVLGIGNKNGAHCYNYLSLQLFNACYLEYLN